MSEIQIFRYLIAGAITQRLEIKDATVKKQNMASNGAKAAIKATSVFCLEA